MVNFDFEKLKAVLNAKGLGVMAEVVINLLKEVGIEGPEDQERWIKETRKVLKDFGYYDVDNRPMAAEWIRKQLEELHAYRHDIQERANDQGLVFKDEMPDVRIGMVAAAIYQKTREAGEANTERWRKMVAGYQQSLSEYQQRLKFDFVVDSIPAQDIDSFFEAVRDYFLAEGEKRAKLAGLAKGGKKHKEFIDTIQEIANDYDLEEINPKNSPRSQILELVQGIEDHCDEDGDKSPRKKIRAGSIWYVQIGSDPYAYEAEVKSSTRETIVMQVHGIDTCTERYARDGVRFLEPVPRLEETDDESDA